MAQNKSRLGTGVFLWEGNEIKLQPSLDRLKNLTEATGEDGLNFLASVDSPMRLTTLFHHLQIGSAYSEEDIYSYFFGNFGDFEKEEFQEALMTCFSQMTGKDLAAAIKPADDTQKK
ncbi:hypothetical protein [uncultured Novosphingobium sp.]|uniref:hypothetical protein n=1 Tax=uncultured Novosphingobium sp. TaxID=292277 RepID=UPI0025834D5F|nr:hypothetical protein [uncultured Novosphingobium sp.]